MTLKRKRVLGWGAAALAFAVILVVRGSMYQVFPHEQVLVLQCFGQVLPFLRAESGGRLEAPGPVSR